MYPVSGLAPDVHQHQQSEPRLVRAAHEFEGQLMKELLKPLNLSDGLGDDDSGSAGALGDFASEALGQALSRRGGFGIADKIVGQLSHSGMIAGSAKVTRDSHENIRMRPL